MTFDAPAVRFEDNETMDFGDLISERSVHTRIESVAARLPKRNGHEEISELRRAPLGQVDRIVATDEHAISFGPFCLLPKERLLLQGDVPVRLGSRAFDILTALIERSGRVVGKDQLIARAWPSTFVDESNLKFQVSALRRILGEGSAGARYIETVPGRGYCFVAPLGRAEAPALSPPQAAATSRPHNLPALLTRLIGRADIIDRLARECRGTA